MKKRASNNFYRWINKHEVLILRLTLGIIFFWFGILKLLNISPVLYVIEQSYPFLAPIPIFRLLGLLEVVVGLALLAGYFLRTTTIILMAHLLATLLVFFINPSLAFYPHFPILTVEGEFILKNIVLLNAGLLVISHLRRK
jgi:putative oxidoreductase